MNSNKIDHELSEMHEVLVLAEKALLSRELSLPEQTSKNESGLRLEVLMVTAKLRKPRLPPRFCIN